MKMEYAIGADEFISYLDSMDSFTNKEVPLQEEGSWEEPYQGLPEHPDIDEVVDQENAEKAVDTYDKFVGAEVCIPD